MMSQFLIHSCSQFLIHGREHSLVPSHEHYIQTSKLQGVCHFDSDVTRSYDHDCTRVSPLQILLQFKAIFHCV